MMKKRWVMFLAMMMMVGCVGCGNKEEKQTEATTTEAETTEAATTEAATTEAVTTEAATTEAATTEMASEEVAGTEVAVDNPVTYLSMSLADNAENMYYMSATLMGEDELMVEYVGEEKKVGYFEPAVLQGITAEVENLALMELHGQDVYGEGDAYASMYIQYEDGDYISASFSGTIAEEYIAAYEAMDKYFKDLTAELPVYVPQPMIQGEVDASVLTEMQVVLNDSGIEGIDGLAISEVPMDEYFVPTMGLSKNEGIVNGTNCYPMMSSIAYSFVVATVENEDAIAAVRNDFKENLNWAKWVCVSANNALIAQKGNMVVCLMGSDSMFDMTAQAIEKNGWTELEYIENPGM